jgi:hypothetical protein
MPSFNPSAEVLACSLMCSEVKELQARAHGLAPGPMASHTQVTVESIYRSVEVDSGIADLLEAIWDLDVDTTMSCEDNMGSVWVQMNLEQFQKLHSLSRQCDDLAFFLDSCHYSMECWTPEHYAHHYKVPAAPAHFVVGLRFPKQHKPLLCSLLGKVKPPSLFETLSGLKRPRTSEDADDGKCESDELASLREQLADSKRSCMTTIESFCSLSGHCEQVIRDVRKKRISAEEGIASITMQVGEPDSDSECDTDSDDPDAEPRICNSCGVKG